MVNIRAEVKELWNQSSILTFTAILMLAAFAASLVGILIDPRIITGMPAWLKPAKFGISTAIFTATVAWLFRYLTIWRPFLRAIAWTLSLILIVEVAIIDLQAWRGTTSHFNQSTPLDKTLFGAMGIGIGILLLCSIAIVIALFKQKFENRSWGMALRLGMLINVLGSATGGFMVAPTHAQLEALRHRETVPIVGAHTVGAPDGGPGLPGVGWSVDHGDLRIPHFLGLHAIQAIPLFAFLFARRRTSMVAIAAASYFALTAILTWQALKGESIVAPDSTTLAVLGVWALATFIAMFAATRTPQPATAEGY
jgi:hypothetical protein